MFFVLRVMWRGEYVRGERDGVCGAPRGMCLSLSVSLSFLWFCFPCFLFRVFSFLCRDELSVHYFVLGICLRLTWWRPWRPARCVSVSLMFCMPVFFCCLVYAMYYGFWILRDPMHVWLILSRSFFMLASAYVPADRIIFFSVLHFPISSFLSSFVHAYTL